MLGDEREADTMTCQWEECGKVFNHLPTLIDHIHNGEFYIRVTCVLSGGVLKDICTVNWRVSRFPRYLVRVLASADTIAFRLG